MFCYNCGTKIKEGNKFCTNCGCKVKEIKKQILKKQITILKIIK